MAAKQMTPRQQVTRYFREIGGKVNSGEGWVSISLGEWGEIFDDWKQALDYTVKAKWAHIDFGTAYPWQAA